MPRVMLGFIIIHHMPLKCDIKPLGSDVFPLLGNSFGMKRVGYVYPTVSYASEIISLSPGMLAYVMHNVGFFPSWKPKLGLFFQNFPPTYTFKTNGYALQRSQVKES
jgi:hypothetical protein